MNQRRSSIEKGNDAERYVSEYLIDKGYEIIDTNFRKRSCEIDLVVSKAGSIIFIEVKSLSFCSSFPIEDRVTNWKLHKIQKCINYWLMQNPQQKEIEFSIAVIEVGVTKDTFNVVNFTTIGV